MFAYAGKMLMVDLSNRQLDEQPLPEEMIEKYIGGKGFGRYLLWKETPAGVDPLGPENRLIFTVGPAAGTAVPTGTKFMVTARSPLTGAAVDSYCGGSWGHALKLAGFDVVNITGAADQPLVLVIDNGKARLQPAGEIWGKDIYQTEDMLRQRLGGGSQWKIVSIGPAGENMVRFAAIGQDKFRHLGRSGSGAVMGSKNLKAIAVRGSIRPEVHDPEGLKQYLRSLNRRIKEHPGTGHNYPVIGTPIMVAATHAAGVFPSRNWQQGEVSHQKNIDADALQPTRTRQARCFGCNIACGHVSYIEHPRYGKIEIDGPEYETIYAFGGQCMIANIEDIIALNDICDRLGLDTISCGATVGFAMEAWERGDLKLAEPLRWGDTHRVARLLEEIAYRRGDGELLAEGSRRAAQVLGVDYAVHVKGLEPAGYDPRGLKSMALSYAVASRGATHLASGSLVRDFSGRVREHELSDSSVTLDRFSIDHKAELVFNMMNFNTLGDCLILCRFLHRDLTSWEENSHLLQLLTGEKYTPAELQQVALRINTLNRLYNLREGFTAADDCLPSHWHQPLSEGNSAGAAVTKEEINTMLQQYYRLRGWDEAGVPTPETLSHLRLTR